MDKKTKLIEILNKNLDIGLILEKVNRLNIPNWYLGAGGVAQTIWNTLHDLAPNNGIKDYDLVYYDSGDISYGAEDRIIQESKQLFSGISIPVEIINEARVHLWYEQKFGVKIKPYYSTEDAIKSWPTTATSIGIRLIDGEIKIYAPYGLEDLLDGVVRANKVQITKDIYEKKVSRWVSVWPKLKVIPW